MDTVTCSDSGRTALRSRVRRHSSGQETQAGAQPSFAVALLVCSIGPHDPDPNPDTRLPEGGLCERERDAADSAI